MRESNGTGGPAGSSGSVFLVTKSAPTPGEGGVLTGTPYDSMLPVKIIVVTREARPLVCWNHNESRPDLYAVFQSPSAIALSIVLNFATPPTPIWKHMFSNAIWRDLFILA